MARGSTRFEHLEKSIDDRLLLSSSKTKTQELRRREMWGYSLNFWEKNTSKEILKTSKPKNWTNISASLSLVWSEKTAKTFNLQVLEVCFQVLIDIWKNANIPSVSSKTLLLNAQENVLKLKTSNLRANVCIFENRLTVVNFWISSYFAHIISIVHLFKKSH